MDLTERHALTSGSAPWDDGAPDIAPSDMLPSGLVDVAICGAGIMGAMLVERLSAMRTARGRVADRRADRFADPELACFDPYRFAEQE